MSDECMRLLLCRDCHSTEELPDFDGDPRDDAMLEYAVKKHKFPNGEAHFGKLFRDIKKAHWEREEIRRDLLKRVWETQGFTGLEPWVYASRDTLRADAYQCWQSRQRPKRCSDFHSDKKRLTPPTASDRKEAGLGKYKASPGQTRYLCDFCVCRMQVETEINAQNPNL